MSRVRSWLAAPFGARLLGVALALAGVALLVLGVLAFGASDDPSPGAAPGPSSSAPPAATGSVPAPATTAPSTPATTGAPTSQLPATSTPVPPATTTATPPGPVRAPVTVLNNSTIRGLGERAAAEARAKGWTVASVGNFAGVIPVSTVYFTPGNATEEAAAEQLAVDLPQVDRVMPRYEGLPPTPPGIVLVVTRDW